MKSKVNDLEKELQDASEQRERASKLETKAQDCLRKCLLTPVGDVSFYGKAILNTNLHWGSLQMEVVSFSGMALETIHVKRQ